MPDAKLSKSTTKLNDRQAKFVDLYLTGEHSQYRCAELAGYSKVSAPGHATAMLRSPKIIEAIERGRGEFISRTGISAEYVVRAIKKVIERGLESEQVVDNKGKPVTVMTRAGEVAAVYSYDPASVLKGAELLGRVLGLADTKVQLEITKVETEIDFGRTIEHE